MFWEKLKNNERWLVIAMMVAGAVLMTLKIADNFVDKDGLTMVDHPVNQLIVGLRTPALNKLMLLITVTGNWQMVIWGTLLAAILLIAAKKRRYLMAMLISNGVGVAFITLAKTWIGRERPPVEIALLSEHGFAFPSGHSYFAVVFYGLLAYFWAKHLHKHWEKILMVGLGGGFVLILAFSRIYLGVHWTTDVLAGLSISLAWLGVTIAYLEYKDHFFSPEKEYFNRQRVWLGFWLFGGLWLLVLGLMYYRSVSTLGTKMIKPIKAEATAMTITAPAARSRGSLVA